MRRFGDSERNDRSLMIGQTELHCSGHLELVRSQTNLWIAKNDCGLCRPVSGSDSASIKCERNPLPLVNNRSPVCCKASVARCFKCGTGFANLCWHITNRANSGNGVCQE